MTSDTSSATSTPTDGPADEPVRIRAHHRVVKKRGYWTTARQFDVRASRGGVLLDLLLPRIEPGDIEIRLDVDHGVVKLLVPDGANVDDDDLRRVGKGRVKDWTGTGAAGGRRIRLLGELRNSEVRVHRGGVAILSLMLSLGHLRDVRQAHGEGRLEYLHDAQQAHRDGSPRLTHDSLR
jgi:hypothetical protein